MEKRNTLLLIVTAIIAIRAPFLAAFFYFVATFFFGVKDFVTESQSEGTPKKTMTGDEYLAELEARRSA